MSSRTKTNIRVKIEAVPGVISKVNFEVIDIRTRAVEMTPRTIDYPGFSVSFIDPTLRTIRSVSIDVDEEIHLEGSYVVLPTPDSPRRKICVDFLGADPGLGKYISRILLTLEAWSKNVNEGWPTNKVTLDFVGVPRSADDIYEF